ncbi:MAG TPA: hypothetical protein PKC21_03165 [Oligoflexia bacterium]|nr:hypothetical protein [Oligoflexia bacterium]HMR24334.1 hypothetical protein [Oligoflexia bacterium]
MLKKTVYVLLFSILSFNTAYSQNEGAPEQTNSYKPQILYIGSWTSATPYLEPVENRLPGKLSAALTEAGFDHELIDVSQPYFQIELHMQDYAYKALGMGSRGLYYTNPDWTSKYVDQTFLGKVNDGSINPDWIFIEGGARDLNLGHFSETIANMLLSNIPEAKNKKVNVVFLGIAPPKNVAQATVESVRIMSKTMYVSKDRIADVENAIAELDAYFTSLSPKYTYASDSDVAIEDRRTTFVSTTLNDLDPKSDFQLPSEEALKVVMEDDFYEETQNKIEKFRNNEKVLEAKKVLESAPFVLSPSGMEKAVDNIMTSLNEQRFFEVAQYYLQLNQED